MAILLLCQFGCKMPISAHIGEVLRGFDLLNVVGYCRDPQKGHPWPETCVLAHSCADRSRNATWACLEESKKKEKKPIDVTSHIFALTIHVALPHQSCHVGWGPGHSQPCQVSTKSVQGSWLPDGSKSAIFLCLALWLISHAGTIVPECFKDDNASQWKSEKFDPRSLINQ